MRKFQSILLVLALALTLCGCRQNIAEPVSDADLQTPVLRMVCQLKPHSTESYDKKLYGLTEQFTQETGIEVSIKTIPWDQLDETMLISSQSGEPLGDLFVASSQKLEYLVNGGALMPLDDYFNRSFSKDEFLPYALEAGTSSFDGKLYLMLQGLHTRGIWYNKNYIPNPPKTLDEVLAFSKQAMAETPGLYGFGFWGGSHYGSVESAIGMLTWAAGGSLSADDGRAAWANDAVADSIRLMYDWVHKYKISPEICLTTSNFEDVQEMFYNGELAMILDGCFSFSFADSEINSEGAFGFAPMPGADGPSANFSNGWALGIASNATHPDLAWKFIEWYESKEIQISHALTEGAMPIRIDALEDPRFLETAFAADIITNQTEYGRKMDTFIYYAEAMNSLTGVACEYNIDPNMDLSAALKESMDLYNNKFYS